MKNSALADDVCLNRDVDVFDSTVGSWVAFQTGAEAQNCRVSSFTYFATRARAIATSVGRFCSIGPNVICGCGEHPTDWISTAPVFYSAFQQCGRSFAATTEFQELAPVVIGNDCWIGANAVIRNGLTIGHGAVIAAGAVVIRDVPDYSIVGGIPAKILGTRFESEVVRQLLDVRWWDFPAELLEKESARFRTRDAAEFLTWAKTIRSDLERR